MGLLCTTTTILGFTPMLVSGDDSLSIKPGNKVPTSMVVSNVPLIGGIGNIFHHPIGNYYKWYRSGMYTKNWVIICATDPTFFQGTFETTKSSQPGRHWLMGIRPELCRTEGKGASDGPKSTRNLRAMERLIGKRVGWFIVGPLISKKDICMTWFLWLFFAGKKR